MTDVTDTIKPADANVAELAKKRLDSLTKPQGSLGALEECAWRYAAARGDLWANIEKPTILTFAGDHGVAKTGVSAYPQEVTPQMVANFANGGAAINVLTKRADIVLKVVDIGVAAPCDFPGVVQKKVAPGTQDFTQGPAMTEDQTRQALEIGMKLAEQAIDNGCTLIGTGDMGIGNTTPSAALYTAFLGVSPEQTVGRGTGVDDEHLKIKISAIETALKVNKINESSTTMEVLARLGGFEIAGICGAILGAAAKGVPVVVDGYISGAAAVTAMKFNKHVLDYCFFSHLSAEAGHKHAMSALGIKPLLDLGLRLGEGTGAALAMDLIKASVDILHKMATFADAGVSEASQ